MNKYKNDINEIIEETHMERRPLLEDKKYQADLRKRDSMVRKFMNPLNRTSVNMMNTS